jgi:hypothetical protein
MPGENFCCNKYQLRAQLSLFLASCASPSIPHLLDVGLLFSGRVEVEAAKTLLTFQATATAVTNFYP